ncbi:MAG: tRNA (adenosine(37)-N6)-threonylcarbamoyltransferase complex dimerization subunit type 1 TsaB [Rhodococcus sp. (in: high G+C Gram-positive bacteria)]
MLILAVDTSTPAVTAGVVRLDDAGPHPLATRVTVNARAHAEVLTPQIVECLAEAGVDADDLDAVVVGTGPGPFTGLRVGMATAAAFADALDIPVHGVGSLDAIAAAVPGERHVLVVTDARRREVYWARYRGTELLAGPFVTAAVDIAVGDAEVVAGSALHVDMVDLPVEPVESPSPECLVAVAADALLRGDRPAELAPQYLRRPDAVATADRAT